MPIFYDKEFGKVVVRRTKLGSQVRLRVAPDGTLRASLPPYAPILLVKRLLSSNRDGIRELIDGSKPRDGYYDGMIIGKSHTLRLVGSTSDQPKVIRRGLSIEIHITETDALDDPVVNRMLRDEFIKALRIEAKSYLPRRVEHLSSTHGFTYSSLRFSHSSGRWGSCSSKGTISLNIALMKLPFEIIDYVILHELAHTIEMNHSRDFWDIVASVDPNYKQNRKNLRIYNPSI